MAAGAGLYALYSMDHEEETNNAYVEMLFPEESAKLILNEPPPEGSCARLRVYASGVKHAVVQKDVDLLTADDYRTHAREVVAAIYEELVTWHNHGCFERCPRRGAKNILDIRWVGKFKMVKSAADPSKLTKIIRMRMTLRGFKDWDAHLLVTYAGTSQRVSQRLLASEAATRGWPMATSGCQWRPRAKCEFRAPRGCDADPPPYKGF